MTDYMKSIIAIGVKDVVNLRVGGWVYFLQMTQT